MTTVGPAEMTSSLSPASSSHRYARSGNRDGWPRSLALPTCSFAAAAFLACLCDTFAAPAAAAVGNTPRLTFEKTIGDARGKSVDNLSVSVADDGTTYLLMRSGRVAGFDRRGVYLKTLETELGWPQDRCTVTVRGRLILVGDGSEDYPWVYASRRHGASPGEFDNPGLVSEDADGMVYVADTGNRRVQIFAPGNQVTPALVVALATKPLTVAARGRLLAVGSEDDSLAVYERAGDAFALVASGQAGGRTRSLAIGPDEALYVARHDSLKRFTLRRDAPAAIVETGTIAPSYQAQWPNVFAWNVSLVRGPDGLLYFPSDQHGRLLSLDPATDTVRERGPLPARVHAIAFAADGTLLAGCTEAEDGAAVIQRFKLGDTSLEPLGRFAPEPLYRDRNVPVWDLLPDPDGGVFTRVIEEGYLKGWPALTLRKLYPAAPMKPFVDFGHLYAKRTTFHPSAATYSLQFAADGTVVCTAMPLVAVCRLTPDGKTIWEAGREPRGGADNIEFKEPRAVALDSHGRIWVTDGGTDRLTCLSGDGKLLLTYGGHACLDDTSGTGFSRASGLAVTATGGKEFLYVGDSGNLRIVKFRLE